MNISLQVKAQVLWLPSTPNLNKTIKENQLSFKILPPTATETVDSAQLMRKISFSNGNGKWEQAAGHQGKVVTAENAKENKKIDFTTHFNPT